MTETKEREIVFMECGHSANSKSEGNPYCVICSCGKIADKKPDLKGRKSKCPDCKKMVDSDFGLAFFEYRPGKDYDLHYDGCRGWN